ncbi:MAG: multidrug ABC transporter ATP-binding protein [Thaumarchaeota archaeon]|nr:MAG: multidrug ABC transporter ATP-binding protein [Nitrososphaerota archaeon]
MSVVSVDSLEKRFGRKQVLKGVSFEVSSSEIFGIIGPNGAGKTTTLRILSTILTPDSGDAVIMGYSVKDEPDKVRRNISYLPEDAGVYNHLTGYEFLKMMADVYGKGINHVKRGMEISGLKSALESPMGSYSKGMKRRILLAAVLMVEPKVAILDEPTSGLDVRHAFYIRKTIREYVKTTGASAIISSHNMLEVEYICDRVAFIDDGKIIMEGKPEELKDEFRAENLEEVFAKLIGGM